MRGIERRIPFQQLIEQTSDLSGFFVDPSLLNRAHSPSWSMTVSAVDTGEEDRASTSASLDLPWFCFFPCCCGCCVWCALKGYCCCNGEISFRFRVSSVLNFVVVLANVSDRNKRRQPAGGMVHDLWQMWATYIAFFYSWHARWCLFQRKESKETLSGMWAECMDEDAGQKGIITKNIKNKPCSLVRSIRSVVNFDG